MLRRALVFVAAYFSLWHFAKVAEIGPAASAFYPSAGVLVFFIHRWGWRYLPVAVVAMLLVDISQNFGLDRVFSHNHTLRQLVIYGGLALAARHWRWLSFPLHSLHGALKLVGFCVGASLLSALWAMAIFWWFVPDLRSQLGFILLGFWIGDFSGLLMFLGSASVIAAVARQRRVPSAVALAGAPRAWPLVLSSLSVAALMTLLTVTGLLQAYSYLILLPVMVTAIAFGLNSGIAAAVLANLSAVLTYVVLGTHQMEAIQLQSLCVVVALVGLLLGAAIDDRLSARFDAWHDPLTGLFNRRAFFDQGETLWARARRGSGGVAAISVDLDYFKAVNDTWGHDAGDQLLIRVAECCREVTRRGDLAARMGGEEFVILVECEKIVDAAAIAERLRLLVARLKRGRSADNASASFGVSWARPAERSLEELLCEADRLLYVAKETGRNRVVVEGTTPAGQS